jgi:serine O-acetyltransferase
MKLSEVREYIAADLKRYTANVSAGSFLKNYVRNRSFRYCFWFRLCEADNKAIFLAAAFMNDRLSKKFGIQIPRRTKIGKGLYIGHYMALVVHPYTVIGENCNLSQFTTIGSNNNTPARIGNNVYIGPGCSIVEDVTIGDNAIIGAGSIVVKSIPGNCTAAGNPAKVVSKKYRAADGTTADPGPAQNLTAA